ncbi:MAG: hypothetical protein COS98_00505 [Parcubacteria group bacterium CG07_land_8_20_14_0_80_35_11]|nr:MAG: hypothetical protein COS98_00505 [Parcubacteria group bacterium CG07_land_8_20_14_0_80_35_11]
MKNINPDSFSIVELIVAISMILILAGMFFLNYQFQEKFRDLTDANHILLQRIRKAQNMAMAQSKLPTPPPVDCRESPNEPTPTSYGVYFEQNEDFFDIIADKDNEGEAGYLVYNLSDPNNCSCAGDDECIERIFLPTSIKINDIKVDSGPSLGAGWVNFFLDDLSVKIYDGGDYGNIKIETCIASENCMLPENIKTIKINNKGMVEIQD